MKNLSEIKALTTLDLARLLKAEMIAVRDGRIVDCLVSEKGQLGQKVVSAFNLINDGDPKAARPLLINALDHLRHLQCGHLRRMMKVPSADMKDKDGYILPERRRETFRGWLQCLAEHTEMLDRDPLEDSVISALTEYERLWRVETANVSDLAIDLDKVGSAYSKCYKSFENAENALEQRYADRLRKEEEARVAAEAERKRLDAERRQQELQAQEAAATERKRLAEERRNAELAALREEFKISELFA